MAQMWMVRSDDAQLYDAFRERSAAGVGWRELAEAVRDDAGVSRDRLIEIYCERHPDEGFAGAIPAAAQVWRFVNEIAIGDWVLTYSPSHRVYLPGKVTGAALYHPKWKESGMALARRMEWEREIERDALSVPARNALASPQSVFPVPAGAMDEILAQVTGKFMADLSGEAIRDENVIDVFDNIESQALERIKDKIAELDTEKLRALVAGALRATGYKTQLFERELEHDKDVVAWPDGFGFGKRRIVVEIRHREGAVDAERIRGFFDNDNYDQERGLCLSTGGFDPGAQEEADRALAPLALWTLDDLVRTLIEHYDALDEETRRLLPLTRVFWPA
ncbi:MAG: restriction endonuclease [Xanthomonadaceae bacterium]|nr:restriction endonuclease [Xanthomonadaceae bacterium]